MHYDDRLIAALEHMPDAAMLTFGADGTEPVIRRQAGGRLFVFRTTGGSVFEGHFTSQSADPQNLCLAVGIKDQDGSAAVIYAISKAAAFRAFGAYLIDIEQPIL